MKIGDKVSKGDVLAVIESKKEEVSEKIIKPKKIYLGRKDMQQLLIIETQSY